MLLSDVKKAQEEFDKLIIPKESQVVSYFRIREQLEQLGKQFQSYLTKPNYLLPFLQPGRLVRVNNNVTYALILPHKFCTLCRV